MQECKDKSGQYKRRQKRREDNFLKRTSAQSRTPLTALTKPELKVRGGNMKTERRIKAATIKRLEDRITSYKIEETANEELLNHMNDALMYAQNNQSSLYETIETTLMELLKEEAQRDGTNPDDVLVTHEDTQKLVDFIAESMQNHIHKVNGNGNRYRCSPYLMGLVMNQYI